jgi:hypothetical protein
MQDRSRPVPTQQLTRNNYYYILTPNQTTNFFIY